MAARPEPQANSGPRQRAPADWTGREIADRYVIRELLGEGGMGVVYVAEHLHLKKRVAFKIIHPDLAAHEELLLRFQREALATGQLDHPHIAAAIDFGALEGGGAFMVMPLVRGPNLQAALSQQGKFEVRRAARIGAQIADALSAAHAVGIVHRDLKPENVLLEQRGDGSEAAKVLDFGVASLSGPAEGSSIDARPLTQAGTILGTPGYMSPEQATAGEVDHRTDLYALGVILWELCRGERLFDGDDITQIFAKQFTTLPPALELGFSRAAHALSALVGHLLAWDKGARPSSAAEVRDALRRIAELPDSSLPALQLPLLSGLLRERLSALLRHPLTSSLRERLSEFLRHPKQVGAALAVLLALALWTLRERGEPAPAKPSAAASGEKSAKRYDARRGERGAQRAAARPPREELAAKSAPRAEPARKSASRDPEPSDQELEDDAETLLRGRTREARRAAAKQVLRNTEQAQPYLQLVADLELADRCSEKKRLLGELRELADARVLPALDRLAEQPRRGCGLLKLSDCLACLRRELDQTIGALEHAPKPEN